jgi:hypothetical protein
MATKSSGGYLERRRLESKTRSAAPRANFRLWAQAVLTQRSSLPPYTDVLSFRSEAPTAPTSIQDLLACGEVIR